ncbi:MAG: CgeB family protein [Phycisphaerae bacterium]
MPKRFVFIASFYPEFLEDVYQDRPELARQPYNEQRQYLLDTCFALGDAYSANLRALGCEAEDLICNADLLQLQWVRENRKDLLDHLDENIHDRRRQIIRAQVEAIEPDVVYVFEWSPLGDAFLHELKEVAPQLVGQVSSTLPTNRTFDAYDMMLSSWPPIVEFFRRKGIRAEHFKAGFDERILTSLQAVQLQGVGAAASSGSLESTDQPSEHARSGETSYDVTFVGGFSPAHEARIPWLESILAEVPVEIFGYGIERVPEGSPIHDYYRGPAWGTQMYDILAGSKMTLHLQAEITVDGVPSRDFAAAMRFYEATGVGTCLVTEDKPNLSEMYVPGKEVLAYRSIEEAVELIRTMLGDDEERTRIADAGQTRTMSSHTYAVRMGELLTLLES